MQTTFIYGLICPKTNTIRYIGKADDVKRRFRQHIYQSKYSDSNKNLWIKNLIKEGYKPEIEMIDEVPITDWGYWEDFWIKYYKFLGSQLINEMDGGHGYGKHSPETIEKIRQSQIGEKNPMFGKPGIKGMLGKKLSEETKRKISEIKKGKNGFKLSEETKRKISEANKGKTRKGVKRGPMSEEQKKKISDKLKNNEKVKFITGKTYEEIYGVEKANELRENLSLFNLGKKLSEETKKKLSEVNKGKVKSEDVKRKISEKSKGSNNGFYGKKHSPETIEKMRLSHSKNKKSS
jgi:hypothetical protein